MKQPHGKYSYKDIVKVYINKDIPVAILEIIGKVKNINAYVAKIKTYNYHKAIIMKFGLGIRHLELEWGNYSGKTDLIIKEDDIIGKADDS